MKQNKETLKKYFETGDKPTQQQYADLIDSYIDSKQPEGEANRRFVIDETGEVRAISEMPIREFGGNYTITHLDGLITTDEAFSTTVSIPLGLKARNMLVFNRGEGTVTIDKVVGVTTYPETVALGKNESADIVFVSTDKWYIIKR
ncbi:hypothetical protein F7018_00295 [Tenacibaculum aiptasiae]|uniref:Uncharacterized protein n=1 Tax=Tenacibaculum aiptasiae TaxID=426481 RepID=A0A7J5ASH5_9FLAO|nr:hypothetical protein [Tenacibaculum aiptasiae]KAB1160351.1 hypothetical protein F7018_00295 [Tenacibaculum aiptasiae]